MKKATTNKTSSRRRKRIGLITLDTPNVQHLHHTGHETPIDVLGRGDSDYHFPDASDLVKASLKKARGLKKRIVAQIAERVQSRCGHNRSAKKVAHDHGVRWMLPPKRPVLQVIPTVPNEPADALGKTLVRGASGLQTLMVRRQLDGVINDVFGTDLGTLHWAKTGMPERYRDGAISLSRQFDTIIPRYKEALIGLLQELAKRNKGVPQHVLLPHAIDLLNEQLAGFRFISRVYTDSFGQYRDGLYSRQLMAINFFYEQAAALFKRVDPDRPEKTADGLSSIAYQVGDKYLTRFTSMSLATIPGARGPVGIHALQMPFDMMDIVPIMQPLLAHEFRHNLLDDIVGLADEMRAVLRQAIIDDHASGRLKFTSETMNLGDQVVSTRDLMIKLMVDSIGEIDADIAGGVLFSGTSYLYNMMLSFPAMLVRGTPLEKAKKLLRTESVYKLVPQKDGSKALVFEPHPPDYIRAWIVAAALEEIGFKAEADECRRLADFAVGQPLPTHITWVDGGPDEEEGGEEEGLLGIGGKKPKRSDMVIAFAVEDIKAVAVTVARAIIRTKLASLGNRSTIDMIDWNPAREAKVQRLADLLIAGISDVPADLGSVYATYVGSAATLAYWKLLHSGNAGEDAHEVALRVSSTAMDMEEKLMTRAALAA